MLHLYCISLFILSVLADREPSCPFPSEVITFLPYPGDCTKFYQCYRGIRNTFTCPENEYWNQAKSWCDYKENVKCDDITQPPKLSTKPHPVPTRAPYFRCPYPSDVITYFPYPGDCTKFYECYRGIRNIFTCPANEYWNQPKSYCDYRENVQCEDDPKTPATKVPGSTSSSLDHVCSAKPDGSLHRYPGNCAKYIECNEGHSFVLRCPGRLLFDAALKTCNYPDNVDCSIMN